MFGPSFVEILVILLIVLLVLGPARLPGIARSIGRGLREVRKVQQEVRGTWADVEGAVKDSTGGNEGQASQSPSVSASGREQASGDALVESSRTEPSQEPREAVYSADEAAESRGGPGSPHAGKEPSSHAADEGAAEKKEDDIASGDSGESRGGWRRGDA